MYSLPTAFSNSGIIGVSVGPGFRQLMRMPCAASGNERNAVYALIASFERPYAFASAVGMFLAPRARRGEVRRRQQRSEELEVRHPADAGGRRDGRDRAAAPSSMFGITCFGEMAQPAEVDEHHVEIGERVRQPRAVEEHVDDAADLGDGRVRSAAGSRRSHSLKLASPAVVGLLRCRSRAPRHRARRAGAPSPRPSPSRRR